MNIQENISLKPFNTFGIDKTARYFVRAKSVQEIHEALAAAQELQVPVLILGGGSNILLTQNLDALVLKIELEGINVLKESENEVLVEVGAGEIWHEFVVFCIERGWGGVENLSLIPGTIGASPMQNIGAYGVEIKEVFHSLRAIQRASGEERVFFWEDCRFGYRESVFKNELKDKYIITHVTFLLHKKPEIKTTYGAIKDTLADMGVSNPGIKEVSEAVIKIRTSKLPDPKLIGNAGSFFKNPTISDIDFQKLKEEYPQIPHFPQQDGVKIPAAWLIEQAGWKGKTFGTIGVHKLQPLVLVNYGGGDGKDIKELSQKIQKSVEEKFGIWLHPEVNFL